MARIRTIKPDFWTNEKVLSITPLTRLLFIGMWNFADDYGRLDFSPISIKAKVFPNDAISADDVRGMLKELCSATLLMIYTANGKEYIEITGWDHQRIDKRQASKIPAPFAEGSVIRGIPPTPADHSPTPAPVMEGKGEEGKGRESIPEANASGADAPVDPSIAEREFFKRGKEVLGKNSGGLLTKLKASRGHNVSLARAVVETAATKENPAEYIAAVIRGPPAKPLTAHQQERQTGREILDELHAFNTGAGGRTDSGLLRLDPGDGAESLRSGTGGNLIALPTARNRPGG